MFPGIYNLGDMAKIEVPIIPMGLGWSGSPVDDPGSFQFAELSAKALESIHGKIEYSSCRDFVTQQILTQNSIANVLMTGCPVWYDLNYINQPRRRAPGKIKKIVFTTPAGYKYFRQSCSILKQIRGKFKDAEIYVCFHRGILPDKYTSCRASSFYIAMASYAMAIGCKVRDVSYSLGKMDFYEGCDLHIGYRVHAHLMFLSQRKPSILVNEDGRGVGMTTSLEMRRLDGWDKSLPEKIGEEFELVSEGRFDDVDNAIIQIDRSFEVMKRFLSSI